MIKVMIRRDSDEKSHIIEMADNGAIEHLDGSFKVFQRLAMDLQPLLRPAVATQVPLANEAKATDALERMAVVFETMSERDAEEKAGKSAMKEWAQLQSPEMRQELLVALSGVTAKAGWAAKVHHLVEALSET